MLQSANNSIYSNHYYMNDDIFTDGENLINFGMPQDEKIKILFQRDHVCRSKCLVVKRKKLVAEASRTLCSIIHLINDFAGKDILLEDVDRTYNGLNKVVKSEVDTIAAREMVRLCN